jgi:hypothetical protein
MAVSTMESMRPSSATPHGRGRVFVPRLCACWRPDTARDLHAQYRMRRSRITVAPRMCRTDFTNQRATKFFPDMRPPLGDPERLTTPHPLKSPRLEATND